MGWIGKSMALTCSKRGVFGYAAYSEAACGGILPKTRSARLVCRSRAEACSRVEVSPASDLLLPALAQVVSAPASGQRAQARFRSKPEFTPIQMPMHLPPWAPG